MLCSLVWQDSWVLFVEVLNADPEVTKGILTPWIVFYAIATVVSTAAMYAGLLLFSFVIQRMGFAGCSRCKSL